MKVLIWGTGSYYQQKGEAIKSRYEIVAYIDNKKEEKYFEGYPLIHEDEIKNQEFEAIIIMSTFIMEITKKLLKIGIPSSEMIPGMNLVPLTYKELEYISDTNKITVEEDGSIYYVMEKENKKIEIKESRDLNALKNYNLSTIDKQTLTILKCKPVSRLFAYDRGISICRYYIEQFLKKFQEDIVGDILEIGGREYTLRYGKSRVNHSYVLHVSNGNDEYNFRGDLSTGEGIRENMADCFICTQTLNFIFDLKETAHNILKLLKPGGVALITATGISAISRTDMDSYGHFWQFTESSLYQLFKDRVPNNQIEIATYGNVKSSMAYLYGLSAEEMQVEDLEYRDRDYQLLITARIRKPL